MGEGVVYVVYGEAARREAAVSLSSLRQHNDYPVVVVGTDPLLGVYYRIPFPSNAPPVNPICASREAKLNLDQLSPFRHTLYLDADTRVRGDLSAGFRMLADGWDMVIASSGRQGWDVMGHLSEEERDYTQMTLKNPLPLQWQAGVFYFDRERVGPLFAAWREEWERFRGQDQGALLRALAVSPARVWVLGGAVQRPPRSLTPPTWSQR